MARKPILLLACGLLSLVQAFVLRPAKVSFVTRTLHARKSCMTLLEKSQATDGNNNSHIFKKIPEDLEAEAVPFLDENRSSFIECYADSVASINGQEYTIGVPCDHCVALCYFEGESNLVPVELDEQLMDDVFPIAEDIVAGEFGEDLVLERTPQTLTLIGELDDEDDDEDDLDEDEDDDLYEGAEEVEVLLGFEHDGREFNLVKRVDPVLLVGKVDPERPEVRLLLTPEEAQEVMPQLEDIFLQYHERNSIVP